MNMLRVWLIVVVALAASSATAQVTFDSDAYCASVGDVAGGSYQIEAMCRQQEAAARDALPPTTSRTEKYCKEVGDAAGGSYQIYKFCVQQEETARTQLKK